MQNKTFFPMCWKCSCRIVKEEEHSGYECFVLIGCKDCKEIKSYNDAEVMCPILREKENVQT